MNGGFSTKFKDIKFKNYILSYDIVLLTECWLEKSYNLQVDGFDCYSYPRKKSKCVQGGGTVIMIRNSLKSYVSVLFDMYDSILWLRISNTLMHNGQDIYLACVYIPPSCSNFYSLYDCDIMSELENQISIFKQNGQVILLGDTNARTSNLDDFLVCDVLHNDVLKDLCELIYYQTDEPLPRRNNPDPIVNDLGVKILSLCKASGWPT